MQARVYIGAWEEPKIESYKLALRRHLLVAPEDADYCRELLLTPPSDNPTATRRRRHELQGFVLAEVKPKALSLAAWEDLLASWEAGMVHSESMVMASSRQVETDAPLDINAGFFSTHTYSPHAKVQARAMLLTSTSAEFSSAAEVNARFCMRPLQMVHVAGRTHYDLLQDTTTLPGAVRNFLE